MHVLVTVASKHGATDEIADVIAEELTLAGITATTATVDEVSDVDTYDAVVIGSAVYAGHWLQPARDLVRRQAAALAARPVWLFSSGPIGDPPKPVADPVDMADLLAATGARGHRVFTGRLDRDDLGFAERAISRVLRAPFGDFRNWDDIRGWARYIAVDLNVAGRPGPTAPPPGLTGTGADQRGRETIGAEPTIGG